MSEAMPSAPVNTTKPDSFAMMWGVWRVWPNGSTHWEANYNLKMTAAEQVAHNAFHGFDMTSKPPLERPIMITEPDLGPDWEERAAIAMLIFTFAFLIFAVLS